MQRTKDVISALKFLEKHDMAKANITSVSIAKMAAMVASALGGKKVAVTPEDFLPFDTRKMKIESGITDESTRVLKKLLKTQRIDPRLLAVLAAEIKAASMRNEE
jgi:hypothetical protein